MGRLVGRCVCIYLYAYICIWEKRKEERPSLSYLDKSVHSLLVQHRGLARHQLAECVDPHGDHLGGAAVWC